LDSGEGLKPSETGYVHRGRSGTQTCDSAKAEIPGIEKSYRTHYVSPALSERKQQQIAEKLSSAATPVVFLILRDSQCSECAAEIARGSFLLMEAGNLCACPAPVSTISSIFRRATPH